MYTYAVLAFVLLVSAMKGPWPYYKAWDVKFSEDYARENGRMIDVEQARELQVIVWRLGFPLGFIVLAMLAAHLYVTLVGLPALEQFGSPSVVAYICLAALWFLSAPLRRLWVLGTAIKVEKRLLEHGLIKSSRLAAFSAWGLTSLYYGTAAEQPENAGRPRRLFIGRLRWLNQISWLWRWVLYLRIVKGIVIEFLESLIWPLTATAMVIVHCVYVMDKRDELYPWWGINRKRHPRLVDSAGVDLMAKPQVSPSAATA